MSVCGARNATLSIGISNEHMLFVRREILDLNNQRRWQLIFIHKIIQNRQRQRQALMATDLRQISFQQT